MRVLLAPDNLGGVWTYALELTDALAERGVEVVLAVLGRPLDPGQRQELRESRAAQAFAHEFRLEWMPDPWRDVERSGAWLLDVQARVEADVIHLNGYAHAALPWDAPVVVAGHSCVLSWWEAVKGEPAPPEWERYRDVVTRGLRAADAVVAPTEAMLHELRRLYGPFRDAGVVPNGLRDRTVRAAKQPFVLAAGRLWDEAKNVAALDRVAPRLPWPVRVAGDGGHAANVELLGRLPRAELAQQYARAAVFAAPARYEPFGLGALEAGLNGCALVLGDISSLREVWGDAALFVDPADDDALLAGVARATEEHAELGELARARARTYTRERMADAYLELYDRVRVEVAV